MAHLTWTQHSEVIAVIAIRKVPRSNFQCYFWAKIPVLKKMKIFSSSWIISSCTPSRKHPRQLGKKTTFKTKREGWVSAGNRWHCWREPANSALVINTSTERQAAVPALATCNFLPLFFNSSATLCLEVANQPYLAAVPWQKSPSRKAVRGCLQHKPRGMLCCSMRLFFTASSELPHLLL